MNDRYNYSAFYKDKSLHSNEEHKNINRKDLVNEICDLHNTIMENIQDNYLIYISDFEKKVIELNNEFRPKYLNDNIIYHITKKINKDNYKAKVDVFMPMIEKENRND